MRCPRAVQYSECVWITREGGGGGGSSEFLVGVWRPINQILTLFQTKTLHFSHPQASKIHTRFQT